MWSAPVTFGGGTQMTKVSSRRLCHTGAVEAFLPPTCRCQRSSTPSGLYSGSIGAL